MTVLYWPDALPNRMLTGLEYAPQDVGATFDPSVGEPISRPRTTSAAFRVEVEWVFDGDQIAAFEDFYAVTLGQGSERFALRDPITSKLKLWRFDGAYQRQFPLKTRARVQASLLLLPSEPWFAPYGRDCLSTVPAFVADYANSVYGISGRRTVAADLPAIEGTYLVRRTTTSAITMGKEILAAGDITQSRPSGTVSIVGYPL